MVAMAGALVALPATANPDTPPAVEVKAEGNALYDTANLRFSPASVTVQVGQAVRWTNTDPVVPHTATEKHRLWDLGGTYGATPANPSGFGPRETVLRVFEAGTHEYLCRVHPTMLGTVAVPVQVAAARRRVTRVRRVRVRLLGRRRPVFVRVRVIRTVSDVAMRWAASPSGATQGFDVEVRRGAGAFTRFATGTREPVGRLVAQRPGAVFQVRARLRDLDDPAKATEWSPAVTITA
jgi:plastocyanin